MTGTTAPDLRELIPAHAQPDNLSGLVAACLAAGWTQHQLAAELAGLSWAGRGPGWTAAVLRKRVETGPPRPDQQTEAGGVDPARTLPASVHTTDPGLRAMGHGRSIRPHPFTDPDGYGYCITCQLPARNRVHA